MAETMDTLDQVLADARGDLAVLRRHGASVPIERVAEIVEGIAEAAYPFTTFISESEAAIRSGHTGAWFRARYADWARQGYARMSPRNAKLREYLLAIVPLRHDVEAVREDARQAARAS